MVDPEVIRLDCLREAVKIYTCPLTSNAEREATDVVKLAEGFAAFVLGLVWNDETDEWEGPEEDPVEIEDDFDPNEDTSPKYSTHAFNDEGQEL